MNPIRLKSLTPDEFERLCLELVQKSFHATGMRRGSISDPDQRVDIEATIGFYRLGVQCKTGRLSVGILRDTLRQLIRYPHRIDQFILMCAQYPVPRAIDEFRQWSLNAETTKGLISTVELWNPDRIVSELNAHPGLLERIILLLTIPIMFPIITKLGYDPIWFGIVAIVAIEVGLLTPLFGMVIFSMKSALGADVQIEKIFLGSIPFLFMLIFSLIIHIVFQKLSRFQPSLM